MHQLIVPSYVPELVRQYIKDTSEELAQSKRDADLSLLGRVASDNRMRVFWKEMSRKQGAGPDFLHPLRLHDIVKVDGNIKIQDVSGSAQKIDPAPSERRDRAILDIFKLVFNLARSPNRVPTKLELTERRERLTKLRSDFDILKNDLSKNFVILHRVELISHIVRVEELCLDLELECEQSLESLWITQRNVKDSEVHFFALTLAYALSSSFKSPMPTCVANIASVVFNRDVNAKTVEKWTAKVPK